MSQEYISTPGRIEHLDSFRGIGCLGVALTHSLFSFSSMPHSVFLQGLFGYLPLTFFFLLSGFVLGRSLDKTHGLTPLGIVRYYIRRLFRLYPAILPALVFAAIAARFYVIPHDWSPASDFVKRVIFKAHYGVTTPAEYLNSLLLTTIRLDPTLWTVKVEFLCAFILPFLILLVKRLRFLVMPMVLALAIFKVLGVGDPTNIFQFYLGYLIYKGAPSLANISTRQTQWILFLWLICFVFALTGDAAMNPVVESLLAGGFLAIIVPCNWPRLRSILASKPVLLLGRISYSFYLFHLPILMLTWSFMEHFYPRFLCSSILLIPSLTIFLISVCITCPVAYLCERAVERPLNSLGHRISLKLAPGRH